MKKRIEKAALHKNALAASAMTLIENVDTSVEQKTFRFDPLYSGGPLYIDGWEAPTYIDLKTLEIDPAPKVLIEHDWDAVVGKLTNVEIRNENGRLALYADAVVGGTKLAEKVVDCLAVAEWSSSIGVYRLDDDKVEFIKTGESASVNGRTVSGPCYIARTGYLCEGSFVLCGGDGEARAVLAALGNQYKDHNNKGGTLMSFEEWIDAKEIDTSALSEEELAELQKQYEDETALQGEISETCDDQTTEEDLEEIVGDTVDAVIDELSEEDANAVKDVAAEIVDEVVTEVKDEFEEKPVAAALKLTKLVKAKVQARLRASKTRGAGRVNAAAKLAENRRVEAIRELCRAYGRDGMKICATAISEGWSSQRAQKIIEATLEKKSLTAKLRHPGFGALSGLGGAGPRPRDILVAALAMTCGMKPDRVKAACGFDDRVIDAAMEKQYRNTTLRTVVAASNNSIRPGSFGINTSMLDAYRTCKKNCESLTAAAKLPESLGGLSARASFSTINAIDVFSSVLQAFLEPASQAAPPIWENIAKQNLLADLNQVKSYSPTLLGRLTEISATGKIEHVGFTTTEFNQQAKPNAATFVIPYMMIVNDQIDAFADLLQQFSELPNLCIEHDLAELVWRAVDGDLNASDGSAFCSTARGNLYLTGADAEVGAATVTAMKAALDGMVTEAGVPLAPGGEILLVPTEHGPGALQMYNSEWIYDSDTRTKNVWQDMFTPCVWQWLNPTVARAKKDDGSTPSRFNTPDSFTPFMLLRDPQRRPAFCVNKVVGYESPILDQFETPDEWGLCYRIVYPYSVSAKFTDSLVVCAKS